MKICIECNNKMDIFEVRSLTLDAYKDMRKHVHPPQTVNLIIYMCTHCLEIKRAYELMPQEYSFLMANNNRFTEEGINEIY